MKDLQPPQMQEASPEAATTERDAIVKAASTTPPLPSETKVRQTITDAKLALLGDEKNLGTHGHDPHYRYSMLDGLRLLIDTRQMFSRSCEKESRAIQENAYRVFLTDPYSAGYNLITSLSIDIRLVVIQWKEMPIRIVIPILYGSHWRVVRIDIDYEKKRCSC